MNNFSYARVSDVDSALSETAEGNKAKLIAGGTNLVDLIRENVALPTELIIAIPRAKFL
jgi:xanthine dehydrogenase YagS FAD-binding subunit